MSKPSGSDTGLDNPAFADIENIENGKMEIEEPGEDLVIKNRLSKAINAVQSTIGNFAEKNSVHIMRGVKIIFLIAYLCYFAYAMYYRFGDEGSIRLLAITVFILLYVMYKVIMQIFGERISMLKNQAFNCDCSSAVMRKVRNYAWIIVAVAILAAILIYIIVDIAAKHPYNLVSLLGLVLYVVLCFFTSYSPAHVQWRAVFGGLLLQFLLALIILRSWVGYEIFRWMGDRVAEFLSHANEGSKFLFRDLWDANFAFSILPVIVFFSTAISMTYYLGIMQVVILKVAYVMQSVLGTTAAESVNAAANIFIGQSEAPLVIRPLIKEMTRSELHAVMTGGFATIAGTVLAAYISFGVPANHLLGASVMSAPAALAISKLFYPETERSKTSAKNVENLLEKSPEKNIFEAASNGATASIKLVANIAVNLIAFLSILKFVDETLGWAGDRVGIDDLTFGLICSYVFYPLAWMMGVEPVDCRKVAELIGLKTFLNEFIAYEKLGDLIKNGVIFSDHIGANGTYTINNAGDYILNGTTILTGGILQERSEVVATYALCGFANFGSMGIMLGALSAMAPSKKTELSQIVVRALIAGNVACFMTGCISGLMFEPKVGSSIGF